MKKLLTVLILVVACTVSIFAQTEVVPMSLSVGPVAGLALPMGDLGTGFGIGWNAGAVARFGNLLPFSLNASFTYTSLGGKTPANAPAGYTTYNSTDLSLTAGPEFTFPSAGMTPYAGADVMFNMLGSNAPNATSTSRFGLGLGGGVQFGQIDASVKYQLLNLIGKETNEGSMSQVCIRVAYMFSAI